MRKIYKNFILMDEITNFISDRVKLESVFRAHTDLIHPCIMDWSSLVEDIKKACRNSQLMAIAPNTSSSLVQGATASFLPVYSKFFIDNNSRGAVPICPPFIKEKFWFYTENKHLNQKDLVRITSKIQQWIDTGISMELLFNFSLMNEEGQPLISAKDIYETILLAWESECKAIYYIRQISKSLEETEKDECVSCAG